MGHKFSVFKQQPPPEVLLTGILVILSRFELLTSCLSSKRSKPTELKDRGKRAVTFERVAKVVFLPVPARVLYTIDKNFQ